MIALGSFASGRSSDARAIARWIDRAGWIEGIVSEAQQIAGSMRGYTDSELVDHTNRLRTFVKLDHDIDDAQLMTLTAAATIEAVRRVHGYELFPTQLHAGVIVSCGAVAEMQTGEGKTLAIVMPAYFQSLSGRGVHVATPNGYLAERDEDFVRPILAKVGVTTAVLKDDCSSQESREAYRADITYGPGHAFGFDYLRDQLTLETASGTNLGDRIRARLSQDEDSESELIQRGLHASIIDEVDHVLIDDAVSPLLLSESQDSESPDAEVHRRALEVAETLTVERDFRIVNGNSIELTDAGFDRVYTNAEMAVHRALLRPWHEYVVLALRAKHLSNRDVDYVVQDDRVQIVDASTGRIYSDRTWSDGLHQAVEARENLMIRSESIPLARITRQRFYRYYRSLAGMTGTARGCEHEFASVYGMPVAQVPLRCPSRRVVLPSHISISRKEKIAAIGDECERLVAESRAVLIGTLNIAESIEIAKELEQRGICFAVLNGLQDADEAEVVGRAGQAGAVTVATNMAGRGTDISLENTVKANGGLHVIVSQQHSLSRVDRQLVGRCARCGDPGSVRIFVSAEDPIPIDHAPWIGRAITRWHDQGRRGELTIDRHLFRAQTQMQRKSSRVRWQLLRSDQDDERLLSKKETPPTGCHQI